MKKSLAFLLTVLYSFAAFAVEPVDSAKIFFRISHRQFDPTIGDNRAVMDHFVESVKKANAADDIDRLEVRAYASPDGQNKANERLTGFRCEDVTHYIINATGVDPRLVVSIPEGIAWDELRRLVAESDDVPSRDAVLDVLDNTPLWIYDSEGRIVDGRKKRLMEVDAGRPYRWMFEHLFPRLRNAVAVSLYLKSDIRAARDAAVAAARAAANAAVAASDAARAAADASKAASEATADIAEAIRAAQEAAEAAAQAAAEAADAADRAKTAADQAVKASDEAAATEDETVARAKAREAEEAKMVAEAAQAAAEASLSAAEAAKAAAEALALAEQPQQTEIVEEVAETEVSVEVPGTPLHRFALKTNMLYYVALMPNLEIEWRINPQWSLALEANVAWWRNDGKHKYYQIAMASPEVRFHLRPLRPWHGMYVGAFTGGGKYDLENGGTGYKGEGVIAGLSFGYMWPISRCFSLEAGIGVGYMYSRYKEYIPYDGHYLYQRTKDLNYFGPLKLKFAIAWRFNDINKKKVTPIL